MDPNQNNDQAGQVPSMPQNNSNAVPEPSPTSAPPLEPSTVPEQPTPASEPVVTPEVPPPPPVVEEHQEAGQTNDPQAPGSDSNQTV